MTLSIVILGAGVFGVTAALELQRRGHAVTLVDDGPLPHPAASSTDISKAVRADYDDDAYIDLAEEAWDGWMRWNHDWKAPPLLASGVALFADGPLEGSWEGRVATRLEARGYPIDRLDARAACARFPALRFADDVEGYFNARAGWVPSARVMRRLLDDARGAGITLHDEARRAAIESTADGVLVVTSKGRLRADVAVVCLGAWTRTIVPEATDLLRPIAQPVLHVRVDDVARFSGPALPVWAVDLTGSGWYGFPALADGTLKIGNHGPGTSVDPDAPGNVTDAEEAACRAFLDRVMPGAARGERVGGRRCLYCDAPDGDFVIDRVPGRPEIIVAAGGSGHAFKFAPILGRWIADAVESSPRPRFAWRSPAEAVRR